MDSQGTVRSIVWPGVLPFLVLFRTLRVSFRGAVLLAALAGYLLMALGGWFLGAVVFTRSEDPVVEAWRKGLPIPSSRTTPSLTASSYTLTAPSFLETESRRRPIPEDGRGRAADGGRLDQPAQGLIPRSRVGELLERAVHAPATAWWSLTAPVVGIFDPGLSLTGLAYLLLRSGWNVLVWALFGGAIARMAAFELARREPGTLTGASAYAFRQFPTQVLAPLLIGTAMLLVALPLVVMGALMRLDVLAWIAGMLWLIMLFGGFVLAVVVVGGVAGWPLLWAAVAVDRSDPFDAVSRAYAYVYQRPLYLAAYVLTCAVLLMIGAAAFYAIVAATVGLTDWAVGWGSGAENLAVLQGSRDAAAGSFLSGAADGRRFWIHGMEALLAAYPIGFLFSAAVGIYLLLRLRVDAAQLDELVEDEGESASGLPPLEPHPSGVPGVAPHPNP